MEQLLGLGTIQTERAIPGRESVEGREVRYLLDDGRELFDILFKKLVRYINPPIPQMGGAIVEGCRIMLPSGQTFQAVSYKGDIDGWRRQIERGAEALKVPIARIEEGSLILDDVAVPLTQCSVMFD